MILTTKEIAYLLPSFTQRSAISLFSNITATPDGTENESLTKKGIIQGSGYSPEALDLLTQLANPKRCARVIVKNQFFVVEKYTYRNGDKIIIAENKNGEFVINKIDNFDNVTIELSEIFSMSSIKTANVSIVLSVDEMLILLSIIDIYRKNTLLNYAGKTNQAEVVSIGEITSELQNGFENGLVKMLVKNYNYKVPVSSDVQRLLTSLVSKNCLVLQNGYKLTEPYAILATNFLILQSIVLFETFETMTDGNVSVDSGLSVVAGTHDIISFVFGDNTIELFTVSAFQMLSTIEGILSCPASVIESVQAEPSDNSWVCSCGLKNTGNFCSTCGNKRNTL